MQKKFNLSNGQKISEYDLENLVVTAFEGGINYWCGEVEIIKNPEKKECASKVVCTPKGILRLHDAESDEAWLLSLDDLLKGVVKTMQWGEYETVQDLMDEHDAETADVLIQFSIFDEVVFG